MRLPRRTGRIVARAAPILASLVLALALYPVIGKVLDQRFYSYFAAKRSAPAWRDVVIAGIDPATRQTVLDRPVYPLSRHEGAHARLVRNLAGAGARAIVLDLELGSDAFAHAPDSLAEALQSAGMVYLPLSLREGRTGTSRVLSVDRSPDPRLAQASLGAYVVDFRLDTDGQLRRFRMDPRLGRLGLETLPERLSGFRATSSVPILFPSVARPIPIVSYAEVLAGRPDALAAVRGRIVFVGEVGTDAADFVAVPGMQTTGDGSLAPGLPGVAILAATTETLILGAPVRDARPVACAAWVLAWIVAGQVIFPRRRPLLGALTLLAWMLLALAATGLFQVLGNTVFPAGLLFLSLLLAGGYKLMEGHLDTLQVLHRAEVGAAAVQRELALARANQERLLPRSIPVVPGCEVWGVNVSSAAVSGDYYDVIPRREDSRVLLAIADVSGKGLPASLVMSSARAGLHSHAQRPDYDLETTMGGLNDLLCGCTEATVFVTMFLGELDTSTRRLRWARAGHDIPILVTSDGAVGRLEAGGLFLGMFPGMRCPIEESVLAPGDVLCLYTDGVTEARNTAEEEFGVERLEALVLAQRHRSAAGIGSEICRAVEAFSGLSVQADDMTLLVLKVQPDDSTATEKPSIRPGDRLCVVP